MCSIQCIGTQKSRQVIFIYSYNSNCVAMYKRIINIQRIIIFSFFLLVFLKILWYIYPSEPTNVEEMESNKTPPNLLVYECCIQLNTSMKKNLYFLKTHKTGSTTVQNIVMRFAEKYSLSVLRPKLSSYYEPFSIESLRPETIQLDNKYNILAFHMRYTSELKSYQYPDTMMVTILRHPASLFQSAYIYYRMEDTTNMTFEQFLRAPTKPSFLGGVNIDKVYKGYNSMSVDLGFDLTNTENKTMVSEFVENIDREFDFVMITEYMDESLVLLANLMGWPLEYVVYLTLNAKPPPEHPYVQTEEDRLILMELNQVDALLYSHFLDKFLRCIRQYGEDEMNDRVFQLREMNRNIRERCVAKEHNKAHLGTINYILRNYSDVECVAAAKLYGR